MEKIRCPHCRGIIEIFTKIPDEPLFFECYVRDKKGKLTLGREKFKVPFTELKLRVDFLFNHWADYIKVFNQRGELIKEYWK